MATGALDSNGIWQYGEDDSETTFAALLNKLGGSVSTQVGNRKVLQVVTGFTTTSVSTTSTTAVTTGVNATITPKSTSSKILVIANSTFSCSASNRVDIRIYRASTGLTFNALLVNSVGSLVTPAVQILDSPATTSATNYSLRFSTSGGTAEAQWGGSHGVITLIEIGA